MAISDISLDLYKEASFITLLSESKHDFERLEQIEKDFSELMNKELMKMWANKLGLEHYNETLINEFFNLMVISKADYTILFRKLSEIPDNLDSLKDSFYLPTNDELSIRWELWLNNWQSILKKEADFKTKSASMKSLNPVYTWREWMIIPAYEEAEKGDYTKIKELQDVFSNPYIKQPSEIDEKYNRLRPSQYFNYGGVSHYSCSS